MIRTSWFTPFAQVGYEIRIELGTTLAESRLATLSRRLRAANVPLLPEQRCEDRHIVELRKADTFLNSVRHGAVRR